MVTSNIYLSNVLVKTDFWEQLNYTAALLLSNIM